jgi:hypothetical protein
VNRWVSLMAFLPRTGLHLLQAAFLCRLTLAHLAR